MPGPSSMKRIRPILSCTACRERRVRCDKGKPTCARSAASGKRCIYTDTGQERQTTRENEGQLNTSIDDDAHTRRSPKYRVSYNIAVGAPIRTRAQVEDGYLVAEGQGRTRYFGPTFWANAILPDSSADKSSGLLQQAPRWTQRRGSSSNIWHLQAASTFTTSMSDSDICSKCGNNFSLYCCLALLPTRETAHMLCSRFFTCVYPLMPILHIPSFQKDVAAFWQDFKQEGDHNITIGSFIREKPDFVCLISAVMFAGAMTLQATSTEALTMTTPGQMTNDLYRATMKSASLVGFPRQPSLNSLASYIIAEMQLLREEDFADPPAHITTSFRVALSMGLHRDISRFEFPEAETRRRMWWFIIHLDVMISASSGLSPLFIDEEMANAKLISRRDQGPEGASFRTEDYDIRYFVARQRYSISKALRNIIRHQFEGRLAGKEELNHDIHGLRILATEICGAMSRLIISSRSIELDSIQQERLTPLSEMKRLLELDWTFSAGTQDEEIRVFCSFAVVLLHLMLHKVFCVLYYPFVRRGMTLSTRTRPVQHAQAFLLLFIAICRDSSSAAFHWMYPGIYQPLQPLSVLLTDLLNFPHSDEAALSRGLVDAIFDLYQTEHGIVDRPQSLPRGLSNSGKDAWWMLIRSRTRALRSIDQDPHILLPHQMNSEQKCMCGNYVQVHHDQSSDRRESFDASFFDVPDEESDEQTLAEGVDSIRWEDWDALFGDSVL